MIKRPDNHIKETKSLANVQTVWAEWAVNKLNEDYGVDLEVTIFENNESTNINFPAQLKSTDKIKLKNGLISFSIDTEHLSYFFNHSRPFLFILYDNQNETAYWLIIQDYILDILNVKKPNWRRQKYNTLYFPIENKIEDKNELKKAIISTADRIIHENFLKLKFGEGLGLNGTLDDIGKLENFEKIAEIKTKEAKLMLSNMLIYQGNIEEARNKLMDIYSQNKRDIMHLKSVIGLVSFLLISDIKQNKKCVELCLEGITIAKELKNTTAEAILIILKNKAIHFVLMDNVSNLLYSQKLYSQSELGQVSLIFIDNELEELIKISIALNEEINLALDNLIKNEEYYLLIYCLTELLDMSTVAIASFKIFDRESEFINNEIKDKSSLAKHLLKGDVFKDKELELYIKSSVAGFFYYCSENPEAVDLMKEALDTAITLDNKPEIERIKSLLYGMEENPKPYLIKDKNWQLKLTTKEYQEVLKDSLKFQGINFDSEDHITKAISLGLKDADPEKYFKFCKNIYIVYLGGSPLGETIGLVSLGYKLIYCSEVDIYVEGTNLQASFDFLNNKYCKECKKRIPMDPDWRCEVGWFEKRWKSDVMQNVLKKRHESEKNMNADV